GVADQYRVFANPHDTAVCVHRAELLVVLGLVRDGPGARLDHRVVVVGVDVVGPVRSLAQVVLAGYPEQILDARADIDHRVVVAGAVDVDRDGQVIDQPAIARLDVGQSCRQITGVFVRCEEATLDRMRIGARGRLVGHQAPWGAAGTAGTDAVPSVLA